MKRKSSGYLKALQNLNRDAVLILIVTGIYTMTVFSGMHDVLFNIYLLRMGYGPEFIGVINGLGLFFSAFFSLFAGTVIRRVSNRGKMLAGLIVLAAARGLLPLADLLPVSLQTGWLLVTFSVSRCGSAVFFVSSKPLLMHVTGNTERDHAFAIHGATLPVSAFLGSLIGGFLPALFTRLLGTTTSNPAAYRYPLWCAVALLVPAIFLVRRIEPDVFVDEVSGPTGKPRCPYGPIVFFSLVVLLTGAGSGALRAFFNVYLDNHFHVPTYKIGIITALGSGIAAPIALFVPVVMSRLGHRRTFLYSSLAISAGVSLVLLLPHWMGASVGFVASIVMMNIQGIVGNVIQLEIVSSPWRSTMAGSALTAKALGWTLIASGGGFLIAALGYRPFFLLGVVLPLLGAGLFVLKIRNHPVRRS